MSQNKMLNMNSKVDFLEIDHKKLCLLLYIFTIINYNALIILKIFDYRFFQNSGIQNIIP